MSWRIVWREGWGLGHKLKLIRIKKLLTFLWLPFLSADMIRLQAIANNQIKCSVMQCFWTSENWIFWNFKKFTLSLLNCMWALASFTSKLLYCLLEILSIKLFACSFYPWLIVIQVYCNSSKTMHCFISAAKFPDPGMFTQLFINKIPRVKLWNPVSSIVALRLFTEFF